jgi:hypothetical protein
LNAPLLKDLVWRRRSASEYHSKLHPLAPWAGQEVTVVVGKNQVALVLCEHEVHKSLPMGEHRLEVEGPENLLFVHGSELQAVCVEFDSFRVNVRTHVDHPARFYDLFLRNAENLDGQQLGEILHCLISDCCARWMQEQGTTTPSPGLADELSIAAGASLASCGLALIQLDLLAGTRRDGTRELNPV